jgi:hypothetical protein
MKNDIQTTEQPITNGKERHTIAITGEVMNLAFEMQDYFAYDSPAKVINHCVRIGYKFFHENPLKFLELLK